MTTAAADTPTVLKAKYAAEAEYLASGGPDTASFEIMAPFFAPDVVLHQADGLPYGGTWRGHDGMEQFFVAMSRTWDVFDMVEQEFLATGATAVVLTRLHARARATGTELYSRFCKRSASATAASLTSARSTATLPPSLPLTRSDVGRRASPARSRREPLAALGVANSPATSVPQG